MISIGKPRACSAAGRISAALRATRKVLVATARTLAGENPAQTLAEAPQSRQGLVDGGGVDALVLVQAVGQGDQFTQLVFGVDLGAGAVAHDPADG